MRTPALGARARLIILATLLVILPEFVRAVPLQPIFSSCLGGYTAAPANEQLVVSGVYANLVNGARASELGLAGDGHDVLRVDLVGRVGSAVEGYSNDTNKLATLFTDTTTAHLSVYSSTTWLCNSLFPSTLPTPYFPFNTTYCPIPAGDFALNVSIPLYRSYALTTLRTQIRVSDTALPANTLACYNIEFTPYKHDGWYYNVFLWLPAVLAISFWTVSWSARFATGWIVGSGVAEYGTKEGVGARPAAGGRKDARMRKWGTMIISGLSGERLSVSSALLRFVTPGLRDVIYHIQFCTVLGMIAVNWPSFAYPIFAQGAWADLVWNTTLVQGADADSKRISDYPSNYTAPAAYASMMNDPYYPLYLESQSYNPLLDLHGAAPGIESWSSAVGLRSQDLFGTCLVVFIAITLVVALFSVLLWTIHAGSEYFTGAAPRRQPARSSWHSSPQASLGGKEAYEPRSYGWDSEGATLPTQASLAAQAQHNSHRSASAPSKLRRTWFRFKPKGEAGAFHAAALYGNLLRMILMFHLPITAFSIYQLSLSRASIVSRVFAAIVFVLISVLIPAGILFKIKRTPSGKLYDATRTLLSLGPMYNVYVEEKQMFRIFPLIASLIEGIVIGAGQKSGIAQAVIFVLVELAMLVIPTVWYPWGEGASMGAPAAFLGISRVASALLVMLLSPPLSMPASTRAWLAYAVLIIQAIVFVFFTLMLLVKLIEGLIRLFGGAHFDESTSPLDSGLFAAIMDLDCLNGVRGGKAAARKRRKRGSRQLQRNVSAVGSMTTQMMLDRHSQGIPRQPVSEGNTPFLKSYPSYGEPQPQMGYFPGPSYQPPLGPPPLERHSLDSRSDAEPSASGHIMDAWTPQPPAQAPQHLYGSYQGGPQSPQDTPGPSRTFSVIRGGHADYQNPYEVKERDLPQRALSPPAAMRIASPSKPTHSRTKSSTAIVERYDTSAPPSPGLTVPNLYPPGREGPRANNQGLRPPLLAIPKRRSLNNIKDEISPDSQYSGSMPDKQKRRRKSKATGWFGKTDDPESSPAESDDEPGPSRRRQVPQAFEPAPSPLGSKPKGWKAALGLTKRKSLDEMAEMARDENKARKAALATESGALFAGVESPSKGFVVNRKPRPVASSPVAAPSGTSGSGAARGVASGGAGVFGTPSGERSFKVKRMGQQTPEPIKVPLAPPGPSAPSSVSPAISSTSVASKDKLPTKGFKVLGRSKMEPPAPSPADSTSGSGSGSSFVVKRPQSYAATPDPPAAQAGYPPTSFVPVKDKRSSGGSGGATGSPGRPERNPRRSFEMDRVG